MIWTRSERAAKATAPVACVWGAATDKGKTRENNEDCYIGNGVLFAVADGLGGYKGGHIASQLAVNVLLRETFQRPLPLGADPRRWLRGGKKTERLRKFSPGIYALYQAFQQANKEVIVKSQSDWSLASMGTTLCAIQLHTESNTNSDGAHNTNSQPEPDQPNHSISHSSSYFAIANVGDSRIYHLSKQKLRQISVDHTYVGDLVRGGLITDEEAAIHKRRHELTRALGPFAEMHPPLLEVDVWEMPAVPGDRFMLCTDGLVLEVPLRTISKVLKKYSNPQTAANILMKAALDAGGRDNITVLVVDVVAASEPPKST